MIPESTLGELSVLNCGAGDIRVSLDKNNPVDVARAERIITDMLKRGYMLFVDEGDGKLKRAVGFDPEKHEYLIAEGPGPAQSEVNEENHDDADQEEKQSPRAHSKAAGKGKKGQTRGVQIAKAKATGVAPTAGG